MNIIGINDGHNSSVSLSTDDEIVFALSEERPTRKKNYYGYPKISLQYAFDNYCAKDDVDYFGIFRDSTADFLVYLWGHSLKFKKYSLRWFATYLLSKFGPSMMGLIDKLVPKSLMINHYAKLIGVPKEKIVLVRHHLAHAESSLFSLDEKKDWLIFTIDGEGDLESGTVYKKTPESIDLIKLASIDSKDSLGHFYSKITQHLGMKPNQHEFKVMGLEPYVRRNTKEYERVFRKINKLFGFDGKNYKMTISPLSRSFDKFLKKSLYRERFDNIAAASQVSLEETVVRWVENWIKTTGINNIAVSGGVMMNVKLVQKLSELGSVHDFYVTPSSGDETTVFGVCNYIYRKYTGNNLSPLKNLYLGKDWTSKEILSCIDKAEKKGFYVENCGDRIEEDVAALISDGHVVARFNGKDEFGARALGNRSILAHPGNPDTISMINKLVKDRDFWMPFTPSVIAEKSQLYIDNPKKIDSPFMAMTFNTTERGALDFAAATHPYDKTMRIQMVTIDQNPSYYKLIESFGRKTGVYGLLNTSFNLHGYPNVFSPDDALMTLEKSGLEYLSIGQYIIRKPHD
jgi:carbamoyltransferase